jgi:hypothetical protein
MHGHSYRDGRVGGRAARSYCAAKLAERFICYIKKATFNLLSQIKGSSIKYYDFFGNSSLLGGSHCDLSPGAPKKILSPPLSVYISITELIPWTRVLEKLQFSQRRNCPG